MLDNTTFLIGQGHNTTFFLIDPSRFVCGTITHVYGFEITRLTLAKILLFYNWPYPSTNTSM